MTGTNAAALVAREKTDLATRLRERLKLKYILDCKCGGVRCHCVSLYDIAAAADAVDSARDEIAALHDELAAANAERKQYRADGKLLWQHGIDQAERIKDAVAAERERCAKIADKHLALLDGHCSDDREAVDKVAQGYGNAAINIAHAIRVPPRRQQQPITAWDTNPQCCFDDVAWQMRMHYHKHGPRWWEWSRNVDAVWGALLRLAMRELVKGGWRP